MVHEMSARWRLASSDASSFSSSSPAPECVSCREMERFGCDGREDSAGDELSNVFRLAIGSERVVDEWTAVDPPLPLRRKVAGDEQPEAMKEEELDEEESTWTSLDMVE